MRRSTADPALNRHYTPEVYVAEFVRWLGLHRLPPMRILEPCAGDGAIAGPLRLLGHEVVTCDLDPGADVDIHADAITYSWEREEPFDAVISNPPFGTDDYHARHFVERFIGLPRYFTSFLLPIGFMEPCCVQERSRRARLLKAHPPGSCRTLYRKAFGGVSAGGGSDRVASELVWWRGVGGDPEHPAAFAPPGPIMRSIADPYDVPVFEDLLAERLGLIQTDDII